MATAKQYKVAVYDASTTPYTFIAVSTLATSGIAADYVKYVKLGRADNTPETIPHNRYISVYVWNVGSAAPILPGESRVPFKSTQLACATVSTSSINLTWTDNLATDGFGLNTEANYTIQRSTDNSTWGTVTSAAAANSTTYLDTTCAASTLYYYRVYATNTYGSATPSDSAFAVTQSTSTTKSVPGGKTSLSTGSP